MENWWFYSDQSELSLYLLHEWWQTYFQKHKNIHLCRGLSFPNIYIFLCINWGLHLLRVTLICVCMLQIASKQNAMMLLAARQLIRDSSKKLLFWQVKNLPWPTPLNTAMSAHTLSPIAFAWTHSHSKCKQRQTKGTGANALVQSCKHRPLHYKQMWTPCLLGLHSHTHTHKRT